MNDRQPPGPERPPNAAIAAAVRASGDLLFVSGQIAIDQFGAAQYPDDGAAQAEIVLARLSAVLNTAGSSLAEVLKITTYLTDLADLRPVLAVRSRFFEGCTPAATTVQVAALAIPGLRVEIEAIASVTGDGPSVLY